MFRCLPGLLIGIASMQTFAAEHQWLVQEQFETFSLLADFHVDVQEIQKQLTELTSELNDALGVRPTGEPIQIVLFESRKSYLAYLGSTVPTSRDRRAVFVRKGSLTSIYCYRSDELTADLRHEMTHALLHQHVQFLPLWMDEGLAEYFEESPLRRPSSSRTKSVRFKAAVGWSPDLDRLERVAVAGEMDSTDYRDSWALCSFLLNESNESRAFLCDYLKLIHDGNAPPRFSENLTANGQDWQVRAKAYFRKPVFQTAAQRSDLK
jgi:hypothetical protein